MQAATRAVLHAGGAAHVTNTLATGVSTVRDALVPTDVSTARSALTQTAGAARAVARLGGAGANRGGAIVRSLGRAAIVWGRAVAAASAAGASASSGLQNGLQSLVAATPLTQAGFGPWGIAAAPAHGWLGGAIAPPIAQSPATAVSRSAAGLLTSGQGAGSAPVRGVHSVPPRALPAPVPPSPGAVSPASAAGAGGGVSVALALAALLMLAAPWALRRLRLAGEQWRLTPLVLISDRPG